MKDLLKKLIIGSPVEPLARTLYAWISTCGRYDRETLCIMDHILKPQSNCLDIGGHKGDMLAEMLRRSPSGTHFAFEPIPYSYERLANRFPKSEYPQVTIHNVAVSEQAGECTFQYVKDSPALSSLRERQAAAGKEVENITVKTARIDDLVPAELHIDLIKVDVEGAEVLVFRGGLETIKRCQPVIVFEHGLGGADCFGTGPEDVYDLLVNQAGLNISLMSRYLRCLPALSKMEFFEEYTSRRNYYFMAYPAKLEPKMR